MKLANIRLKMDKIGSSVEMKHVSPAEVILLVSDHHANAGGNPVEVVELLEDDAEQSQIDQLKEDSKRIKGQIDELETADLVFDVKERREAYLRERLDSVEDRLKRLQHLQNRRKFTPTQEGNRLRNKYGNARVEKAFPGAIPQMPETFEEACEAGLKIKTASSGLFTVGDIQ